MPNTQVSGSFQPHQVDLLQRAYESVVHEPWFLRTPQNDSECAEIILKSYQDGMTNEFILFRYIRTVARQRFATAEADSQWH